MSTFTLNQLQREQREWQLYNFGEHPAWHPLMGMQEEVGEIAHAVLKREQGIRGTQQEHTDAILDGLADLIIFAADFCNCMDINMQGELSRAKIVFPSVDQWRNISGLFYVISEISNCAISLVDNPGMPSWFYDGYTKTLKEYIGGLIAQVLYICRCLDTNMIDLVEKVWSEVKQRDFKKFPKNGVSA